MPSAHFQALWAESLIQGLCQLGLNYFCISPGSRSTPLTLAIARQPAAQAQIFYDERSAAFHALGYAQATGQAAVLVCTSGSAAAHYFPALIEASLEGLPMLILSADRPPELHHCGANQTIEQSGLFGRYTRWAVDLPCPTPELPLNYLATLLEQAGAHLFHGPVHINCPFREPFALQPSQAAPELAAAGIAPMRPLQIPERAVHALPSGQLTQLQQALAQAQCGLLLIGRLDDEHERQAVLRFAKALGWPVYADLLSGLRGQLPEALKHLELWLPYLPAESPQPDLVLQIGRGLISKRIQDWLGQSAVSWVHLQPSQEPINPQHLTKLSFQADLAPCLQALQLPQQLNPLSQCWQALDQNVQAWLSLTLGPKAPGPLTEPQLAHLLFSLLAPEQALVLANSMPVRDAESFGVACGPLQVFGSRGSSGIDGIVSQASGVAKGLQQPVVVLTGDLSLFHDLNALSLLASLGQQVVVLVVNNGGGGIFSFLPIAQAEDVFETYWGTPHSYHFADSARQFGLRYYAPHTVLDLQKHWQAALAEPGPCLVEVFTERQPNLLQHRQLQAGIQQQVEQFFSQIQPQTQPQPDDPEHLGAGQ